MESEVEAVTEAPRAPDPVEPAEAPRSTTGRAHAPKVKAITPAKAGTAAKNGAAAKSGTASKAGTTGKADAAAKEGAAANAGSAARAGARAAKRPAAPRKRRVSTEVVLRTRNLTKRFGDVIAVDSVDLEVHAGSFFGLVGPNGAGKTTTLSMITGLLRPDGGLVTVHGADVWLNAALAKRNLGVLPDRLRLFDRLTGGQLLQYAGSLRGLDADTVRTRAQELAAAFGLESALGRMVADYSLGMTKKIALACAMLHAPRVLVLDEPFEAVDPVSTATIVEILQRFVAGGGTVLLSSHSMELIQRICTHVAIMVDGRVLAAGTMGAVRGRRSLEAKFVELAGGTEATEGLEWLHTFSD